MPWLLPLQDTETVLFYKSVIKLLLVLVNTIEIVKYSFLVSLFKRKNSFNYWFRFSSNLFSQLSSTTKIVKSNNCQINQDKVEIRKIWNVNLKKDKRVRKREAEAVFGILFFLFDEF